MCNCNLIYNLGGVYKFRLVSQKALCGSKNSSQICRLYRLTKYKPYRHIYGLGLDRLNYVVFWGKVHSVLIKFLFETLYRYYFTLLTSWLMQQHWCLLWCLNCLLSVFVLQVSRLPPPPDPRSPPAIKRRSALSAEVRVRSLVSWRGCWSVLWRSCICQDASCQLPALPESPRLDQGLTRPLCLCGGDDVASRIVWYQCL